MSAAVSPAPAQFGPTASQLAVAYAVCRGITRREAKNFYYAFLVLPKPKRRALCAVYAFMRRCDDISDDTTLSIRERRDKLEGWLNDVHRALAGQPTDDPVLMALTDTQRRFRIPPELLDQLAFGTAMDVQQEPDHPGQLTVQYRTFDELYVYCYRVASVVGLVCIRVFGYRDAGAEPLAERLGLAFQLTNIIRDVKEDAAMGRVYLPQEDLMNYGISAEELRAAADPARFRMLLGMEADRAREYYASGDELIPLIDEDSRPALWVLATIYRSLLEKIALKQYDVFSEKVRLTTREKLMILGKGFVQRLM
ncbi:MAG TPA: phytoene/squalene synthase family protein [Terriglobales bacterium]|nr:phytoene/squalene synthase family protein [Terriglobales bacterium]